MLKPYKMANKAKWSDEEENWEFMGYTGDDSLDNTVVFSINVAPAEDANYTLESIDQEIKMWQKIKKFVQFFKDEVLMETDYYWREGDLMLRISVPYTHKIFKNGK